MKVVNLNKLLPADVPEGEKIVWFGRPDPISLWRRAFRADWVAVYFAALAIWNFLSTIDAGGPMRALLGGLIALGWGVAALSLLGLLAFLSARTTLYVATSRRLIMKCGVALPIFHNIPFSQISSASLRSYADGTGDVAVALDRAQRIAYLTLWPSARPLHIRQPEPSLRSIPEARKIAELVARAMIEANGGKAGAGISATRAAPAYAAPATA